MSVPRLFVGRLAWRTGKDSLIGYFSKFGAVTDARVISDRATGRSRGFGFVTFSDQQGCDAALSQQQHELDGRSIIVNMANEPMGQQPRGRFDSSNFGGDQQ